MDKLEHVRETWEENYRSGRFNRYPYDEVVSFVLRRFGHCSDRQNIRILDLGCGGGNNTKFLCYEGFDTYAVDGSHESINLTRQNTSGCCKPENVIQAYFNDLPFPDDFFDCVVDRQALGHNPASVLDGIIDEVFRVLKVGGAYLGFMFSAEHPHRVYGKAVNENGDMSDFKSGVFVKSGLVHFFTLEEINDRFRRFEIKDIVAYSSRSLHGSPDSHGNNEWFLLEASK